MNILSKKVSGEKLSFTTANEKITVDITDENNGPKFHLEDGSDIRFTDMFQYYKVITDNSIYNVNTQDFNIEEFQSKYFKDSDEVDKYNIDEVEEYIINDHQAFRFITNQ